jgi:hypothetical protein
MPDIQVVPIGQAVGQAEAVLTRLLARVLAETGTSRQDYLAMQRLAALGGEASREAYVTDLGGSLQMDLWSAGELADSLVHAGLLEAGGGRVRFSPSGTALRDRIVSSGSAVTRALVTPVSPADLATTIRVLQDVTARGGALLLDGSAEASAYADR